MSARVVIYDLSPVEACLLSSLLSIIFVSSLYIWALCGYNVSNRNNSLVIKQRIISVTFVCIVCPILITFYCSLLQWDSKVVSNPIMILTSYEYWKSIGVNFDNFTISVFYTLMLMIILFIGPLIENPNHFNQLTTKSYSTPLLIIRGLVIGPVCEEWVYRGCLVSLLYHGKLPHWLCIMIPPVLFGLSHAHHIYYQLQHQFHDTRSAACMRVAFQLFYTSVFGILASIIFIRTGNVFAAMLMHIWCNCMGFPPFTFITSRVRSWERIIHGIAYVFGLVTFIVLLYPLTDPIYFDSPYQFK
eukprot:1140922_1